MPEKTDKNPLSETFRALVSSRRANAAAVIAYSVLESQGDVRRLAVNTALERPERQSLEAVLRVFDRLDNDLRKQMLEHAEVFLPVLRQSVRDGEREMRSNVCDFLVLMDDTRVAYLLADRLQDPIEEIKKKAQDGLLSLAHGYHVLILAVEKGEADVPRQSLETKKYALLDALLTSLRFYSSHERPEMIGALLSLDRRGDEVLMDIIANPMDRRQKIVLDILETAKYPRAISFLLTLLKNPRTSSVARDVLETRFDVGFIKAFLSNPSLFDSKRLREGFSSVEFVPWLRPGTQKADQLSGRLAVRSVRFLIHTATAPQEKQVILDRLAKTDNVPLASAARFVLTATARQVSREGIDAGLTKIEERCGNLGDVTWEPEVAQLAPERTIVRREASPLMSNEVLFRNFMNSFESLARSEKEAALKEFEAKGILRRETRKALRDSEAEIVLRAIKLVEYRGCQKDVARELSLLTKHPDTRVRSSAVRQLGKSGAYEALKALFETLNDRDRRVLANAVEALEETGHRQILRLLEPLFKHPDNRVRGNAAKASWTLGDERGRTVLVDMLNSPRVEMRLSGLWGLRQIGLKEEVKLVRTLAKNDGDERVRNSAEMTLVTWENAQ
jgi:hypothetical protein